MYIYFIQIDNKDKYIKIGKSATPLRRIEEIKQVMPYPIKVLLVIKESHKDWITEEDCHKLFKPYKLKGEWYYPNREILKYIKRHSYNKYSPLTLYFD